MTRCALVVLFVGCAVLAPTSAIAQPTNWEREADRAVRAARVDPQVDKLIAAFDASYRADDWQASLALVQLSQQRQHTDQPEVRGRVARALIRGGKLTEAEQLLSSVDLKQAAPIEVHQALAIAIARRDWNRIRIATQRLEQREAPTNDDLLALYTAYELLGQRDKRLPLIQKLIARLSRDHGYPEDRLVDVLPGVPDFLQKIGPEKVNRLSSLGSAPIFPAPTLGIPAVEVMLNGKGPYRLALDTGGSVMIALDKAVADEINLPRLGSAIVRGVGGAESSEQALIDEVKIGSIRVNRVVTRVLDIRAKLLNTFDGVLGTGIFADGRMTIDFNSGRVIVLKSAPGASGGQPLDTWIIGDAKLYTIGMLDGVPALTLLDSGADALYISDAFLERQRPGEVFLRQAIDTAQLGGLGGVGSGGTLAISVGPAMNLELAGKRIEFEGTIGLSVIDDLVNPILGTQADVLAGMMLFREMATLTVDYPTGKMWVQWIE